MVQVATQQLKREFSETILVIRTMGRQVKVFQCGAELKWRIFNVLDDDDDKHVCDLDLNTGEFVELVRFINMKDNKKLMTILHSASLWCPALFRLQAKVAAVWKVPTCSVQLVSMTKDQRLGVYKRLVDIKTMDMRLEPQDIIDLEPNMYGHTNWYIRPQDTEIALPHWSIVQATWFPLLVKEANKVEKWLRGEVVEWHRVWRLSICLERFRKDDPLPATVIIEVRSYDPDPDTGETVVFESHSQDFARHDKAHSAVELLSAGTLEFAFDLEDYCGFDNKRNNNLGFSLRIQIVEELRDDEA
jgi:hypothetical protein